MTDSEIKFEIKPSFAEKFRPSNVKPIISQVLNEILGGKVYDPDFVEGWCTSIAADLKLKVTSLQKDRYKFVTNVILSEQRGQGIVTGFRGMWDTDTDNYASEVFFSDTMSCVATVYGIYDY